VQIAKPAAATATTTISLRMTYSLGHESVDSNFRRTTFRIACRDAIHETNRASLLLSV
jgi:hypothetical protein